MLVLIGIGLAAGFITAISPCVLPVLPIVFAGGAMGGRRRPFAIVAGLIASFTAFTLFGVWLLRRLGLPQDILRNLAIALLFLVAATLLFPRRRGDRSAPPVAAHTKARRRARRRVPPRGEPRPRVRAVRGAGARRDHGRRRDTGCRSEVDRPHALLRHRRGRADAARRLLRAREHECAQAARAPDPAGAGRRGRR